MNKSKKMEKALKVLNRILHCVCIFLMLIMQTPAVYAEPSENEVYRLWRHQKDALLNVKRLGAETEAAWDSLLVIFEAFEKMRPRLEQENIEYLSVTKEYHDILAELEKQFEKRLLATTLPDILRARRDLLQNRWDLWVNYPSARTIPYKEVIYVIRNDLNTIKREISNSIALGEAEIANVIDPEIARLQLRKQELTSQLEALSQVSISMDFTEAWFNAAQDLSQADQRQIIAEEQFDESFAAYLGLMAKAPPPYLQHVTVKSGKEIFYDFAWVREGYRDELTASIAYARDRLYIAENLVRFENILRSATLERRSQDIDRYHIANQIYRLTLELNKLGRNSRVLEYSQIAAIAVTEALSTFVQAYLAGGANAAKARAAAVLERRLGATAGANRRLMSDLSEYQYGPVRARFADAVDQSVVEQFDIFAANYFKQRTRYVAAQTDSAILSELQSRGFRYTSIDAAQRSPAGQFIPAIRSRVTPGVEEVADNLFPTLSEDRYILGHYTGKVGQKTGEFFGILGGVIVSGTPKVPAYITASGIPRDLGPTAHTDQTDEIIQGQYGEWAIGTGINAIFEVKDMISNPMTAGGLSAVGRQGLIDAVFAFAEGAVKIKLNSYFDDEINETQQKFWEIYLELSQVQIRYQLAVLASQDYRNVENWYRNATNKMKAYLSEIGLPRRAGGDLPEAQLIPSDIESITIELKFPTPLSIAPIVSIGDTRVSVSGEGQNWQVNVTITDAIREAGSAGLTVGIGNGGSSHYDSLDEDPTTIAYIPVRQSEWSGYEEGADKRHKLKFEKKPDVPISFTGKILSLSYPQTFISGGARAAISITVTGEFAFPVTATLSPRSCTSGFTCGTEVRTFDEVSDSSTLYMADALWCNGASSNWLLDYQVQIEDANSQKSNAMLLRSTCVGN